MQTSTKTRYPEETGGVQPVQAATFWSVNRHRPTYRGFITFYAHTCLLEVEANVKEKGVDALMKMTHKRLGTMENGRGNYTRVHSREVATFAWTIITEARKRDHPEATDLDPRYVFAGGYAHDLGKTLMPNALLFKEDGVRIGGLRLSKGIRMTDVERGTLGEHVAWGSACARLFWDPKQKKELGIVRDMIGLHHVMHDGLDTAYPSYPAGVRGVDLPLHARIAKTADFLSAVLPREYRPVYQQQWVETFDQAIAYAITVAGTELDPFTISCLLTGVYDIAPEGADALVMRLKYPKGNTDMLNPAQVEKYVMHVVEKKQEFAEMIKHRCAMRIAEYAEAICTCAESFGVNIAPDFPA
jgi:HD-GYP domain-containing protein (c-di-GMP phosphodiesterase class II)